MSHPRVLFLAHADNRPVDTAFSAGPLTPEDPFASGRQTAFIDDQGIAAGVVQASGSLTVTHYPFTEMLVVHKGLVTLRSEGRSIELERGQSAVIGRGSQVQIDAQSNSQWAFCAATQATGPDKAAVVLIDHRAILAPSAAPEASILIGPTPQCRANNIFEDTASPLRIGVWDSTPYARGGRPHKVHELMHILEGQVALTDDDGETITVKPGDTVFVIQGAPCAWVSDVYVRKFYAVN
jgi:uncharacterized cupin superfamily protein